MRKTILHLNSQNQFALSNDLGAIAGLLFDVGIGRYDALLQTTSPVAADRWRADLIKLRETANKDICIDPEANEASQQTHAHVQGQLRDLGLALGFDVWIASNDRSHAYKDGALGDRCLHKLPNSIEEIAGGEAVRLIDVLWAERASEQPIAAFEVEHSTSIYSGIVRLLDLALGLQATCHFPSLFLVAPDRRAEEVRAQLRRPAFSSVRDRAFYYVPYGELQKNLDSMIRFGQGLRAIEAVAERLNG
jgi:type II restriction enzyme